MNINKIGKNVLYFSMAVFTGLFISLQFLEAHAPVQERMDKMSFAGMDTGTNNGLVQNVAHRITDLLEDSDSVFLPLANSEVQAALTRYRRKGKPIAVLAHVNNYPVDDKGRVLSVLPASTDFDVPVITGSDFKVNIHTGELQGELFPEALQFLRFLKKYNQTAYDQISELHFSPQIGLIVNLGAPYYVPILIGRASIVQKAIIFSRFMDEYGRVEILSHLKYADFRIDGQIILKKNT